MLKHKILIIGIALLVGVWCGYAATSTPWDGTSWDTTAPGIDELVGNHYKEIFDLRKGIAIRMNKEHETLATSSAGGVHKQGSARAFFQDASPATQIDGSAWDAGDVGSFWFDTNSTPDNLFRVLTENAGSGTWTKISESLRQETLSWTGVQTFSDGIVVANAKIATIETIKAVDTTGIIFTDKDGVVNLDLKDGGGVDSSNSGCVDEDITLAANSVDLLVSQRAVKTYIDVLTVRAWGNVGSDGTLNDGFNSSSAKDSTGVYTITFGTNFNSTNYAITPARIATSGSAHASNFSQGVCRISTRDSAGSLTDSAFSFIAIGTQ